MNSKDYIKSILFFNYIKLRKFSKILRTIPKIPLKNIILQTNPRLCFLATNTINK